MNRKGQINDLIRRIGSGERRPAIADLAEIGGPAIDPILRAMETQPCTIHPRDFVESLADVLSLIVRKSPDSLIDLLERNEYPADPVLFFAFACLGDARGRRATDALLAALKHQSPWVRLSAAGSLIDRPLTKVVIAALIDVLKDRSSMVKFRIVEAMHQGKLPCDERAIPALRRIVASSQVKKHSPGLLTRANELLERIKTIPPKA
jgi:HEAT repeat protein